MLTSLTPIVTGSMSSNSITDHNEDVNGGVDMGRKSSISKEGLLAYLKDACSQNGGSIKASIKDFTESIGGSTPTITKYLEELVSEGVVSVKRGRPAAYSVNESPIPIETSSEQSSFDAQQRLHRLLSELAPMVVELSSSARIVEELQELREFKESLVVVYEDEAMTLYKRLRVPDMDSQQASTEAVEEDVPA
jgi:DNA-binding transcriptional regulator YhcF (GntR family)